MAHIEREGDNVTPIVVAILLFIALFITFTVTTPGLMEQRSPQTHFLKLSNWVWFQSDETVGIAKGEFLNRTQMPYSDLIVSIDFKDTAGNFVGSVTSPLKQMELESGVKGTFKIPFKWKSEMNEATVSLLTPSGEKIRFLK